MNFSDYVCLLELKFRRNFNITKGIYLDDTYIDFYAEYHGVLGRTMVTPVDIIDRYETFEKCYVKHVSDCNKEIINNYFNTLSRICKGIEPSEYHMSTDITGILVFDEFDVSLKKYVNDLKFGKLYKWYFKGFGDVNIICVDLKTLDVYTNKTARRLRKIYKVDTAMLDRK